MPLNISDFRTFYKRLYGGVGVLETVTLLKRDDDQLEGVVTAYRIFNARRSLIYKSGQAIFQDMTSAHRVRWHIPYPEIERVGIHYLNVLDRIVDPQGRYWQPESNTTITSKLQDNHFCLECLRVDPTPSIPSSGG